LLILNVVLVGALMASHESDQVEVPLHHVMKDADWVCEGSRWKYKINGCTNAYVVKWLLHQHLDNTHELCMEVGKSVLLLVLGTKAKKSSCYERPNFEQPTCKAKTE
jgi:hypothetical protein